jgi:predicted ABC-type ATPase
MKSIANCAELASEVDRLYVYDNSRDNQKATLLFRMKDGELAKQYVGNIPEWALNILPNK